MFSKKQFTQKLAKRIKQLRDEKGMGQEELAHEAKLYRTYVGHLENARYSPSAYVLYKVARALRVKIDRLFDLDS